MFSIFKHNRTEEVFQKHGLKYFLSVMVIFQMYHAEASNSISVLFNRPVYFLFASHIGPPLYRPRLL